jgi:hypothetical protein
VLRRESDGGATTFIASGAEPDVSSAMKAAARMSDKLIERLTMRRAV